MESILNTEKGVCYNCHRIISTHYHHIFFGKNRKISDKLGLTCYLCRECHEYLHGKDGHELDQELKEEAQEAWEAQYIESYPYEHHAEQAAREKFRSLLGKSYL